MAALASGLISGLIPGLAGLFGGGQQQKVKTEGTISNTGTSSFGQNQTGTSSPNLSPLQQQLINQFTGGASDLFKSASDLSGYAGSGLKNINQGSDIASKIFQSNIANRGLSFSPASVVGQNQNDLNRLNQSSSFLSQLPLLQRQLQSSALDQLMKAFQIIPTGTTTTGTSSGTSDTSSLQHQSGTNLVSGNPTAGAISGFGAGLASPNASGTGTNLGDIIGSLSSLFGGNNNPAYFGPGAFGG